jgi:hypothetical protein
MRCRDRLWDRGGVWGVWVLEEKADGGLFSGMGPRRGDEVDARREWVRGVMLVGLGGCVYRDGSMVRGMGG